MRQDKILPGGLGELSCKVFKNNNNNQQIDKGEKNAPIKTRKCRSFQKHDVVCSHNAVSHLVRDSKVNKHNSQQSGYSISVYSAAIKYNL